MRLAVPRPLTGRHVLAMVLAFFGAVFLANAVFVWLALESWTGIDTENAYVEGLAYQRQLDRAAAQQALGWRFEHALLDAAGGRRLEARIAGPDDLAPAGIAVEAELRRPTHDGEDRRVELPARGDDVFRSDAFTLAPGQWDVVFRVGRGGETVFRREARIWVK